MTVVPPDPKTPYLMKTEVITAEESPDGKLTWNLLLSSSHLIEEFLKDGQEELICMDHTHSLCVENCPVMFVGRVSRAGHFCPFGIVIGNKEAASNSKFVLEWIRDNCSVPPVAVIADGAAAFTAALREIFPDTLRLMCFFHVMKNVKDKLSAVDTRIASSLTRDIRDLAAFSIDEDTNNLLLRLFKEKWTKLPDDMAAETKMKIEEFINYFFATWVNDSARRKWFQGASPCHAYTNNSLEGSNSIIKRDFTIREKLSLPQLLKELGDYLLDKTNLSMKNFARKSTKEEIYNATSLLWSVRNSLPDDDVHRVMPFKNVLRNSGKR